MKITKKNILKNQFYDDIEKTNLKYPYTSFSKVKRYPPYKYDLYSTLHPVYNLKSIIIQTIIICSH